MYKYVYVLKHARIVGYDKGQPLRDTKILGIFSSLVKAKDAINFFAVLPGFIDYPNDYVILKKRLYLDDINSDKTIFLIEYEKYLYDNIYEKSILNLYNNEQDALGYIKTQEELHGFSQETEEYDIVEYYMDKNSEYWGEGFD